MTRQGVSVTTKLQSLFHTRPKNTVLIQNLYKIPFSKYILVALNFDAKNETYIFFPSVFLRLYK